jgi:flagellar M-ring protein FliF
MLNRIKEKWIALGRNNQIIIGATSGVALFVMLGFLFWANSPEYAPLFDNLAPADASSISDKLKEQNVPFRLVRGGATIEVPAQKRDELRLKLIGEGLPQQSSATLGYELLDKLGPMSTPDKERTMMLRATEGEIAKSIMTLKPVASALVHLAPGDESPFALQKKDASASVVVNLRPGQNLTGENVHAIMRLTQMSYTGLKEDKISIVDSQGNLLHDPNRSNMDVSSDRVKQEQQRAQAKRGELQAAVDRAFGMGKAVIMVNLELNADQEKVKKMSVETGAAIKKTSSEETLSGNTPPPTPPGVNANNGTPTYNQAQANSMGNYKNVQTTTENQPSTTETETVRAPGRIEKLTVSALIDEKVPATQVEAIRQTLLTAIGGTPNDPTRVVTVAQVPFDRSEEQAAAKATADAIQAERMRSILAVAVPLVLMLLCLFVLARAFKKALPPRPMPQLALAGAGVSGAAIPVPQESLSLPEPESDLSDAGVVMEISGTAGSGGMQDGVIIGEDGLPISLVEQEKPVELLEDPYDAELESIQHLVKSKPEAVALLLRSWVSENK